MPCGGCGGRSTPQLNDEQIKAREERQRLRREQIAARRERLQTIRQARMKPKK
jgi:hypothetical protein